MPNLILAVALAANALQSSPQELYKYLEKSDGTYASKIVHADSSGSTIEFTSQTWQGNPWRHTILLRHPKTLAAKGTGILFITGDGPRDGDIRQLAFVTEATGLPVAMLFNIPNQPLWNMKEDDLIAHTFEKYLETGDSNWPLLFPMTRSALRAMDAVQSATQGSANPIKKFVVTGASKRGWTTWFVGAARDPRVIGIAPMVYDNLNVARQMSHQIDQWGQYSEQIEDYTRRGLQQKLGTPAGRRLASIIDPYSYRTHIRIPTLIVIGANDRYWTTDAMKLYWEGLRQPKWAKAVPNAGHDLAGGLEAANSIGAFARALAGGYPMPTIRATSRTLARLTSGTSVLVEWRSAGLPLEQVALWRVDAPDTDFRPRKWQKVEVTEVQGAETASNRFRIVTPTKSNSAFFVEFRYRAEGKSFSFTTPPEVVTSGPDPGPSKKTGS